MGKLGDQSGWPWLATIAFAATWLGCGGEGVAPTTVSISAAAPPAVPPAAVTPDYGGWVEREAAIVGHLAPGTVLLRGGKRWLASGDALERQRGPGDLRLALLVPTTKGPLLVGSELYTVARFDDPLGDPRVIYRAEEGVEDLGSTPGHVLLGGDDVFVDVATGRAGDPGLPIPPGSVAFADMQRGTAFFGPLARFFETRDGGATWSVLDGKPLGYGRVGRMGAGLSYPMAGTPTDVDPAPRASAKKPGIVAWLEHTDTDPLHAAATGGIPTTPGQALIASSTRIGRVDLTNGDVLEMVATPEPKCALAATREGPIAVCGAEEKRTAYDVRLAPLRVEGGVPAGAGSLVTMPSGGVATWRSCDGDKHERNVLCVRQPDGTWASVEGSRPRADGTAMEIAGARSEHVEVADRTGKRSVLARTPDHFKVTSISEDEAGVVWLLAIEERTETPRHVVHAGKIDGSTIRWTPLPSATYALRGSMTIGVHYAEAKLSVRTRPDRPAVDIPMDRAETDVEIHPLGFVHAGRAHLGFTRTGARPGLRQEESGAPLRLVLDCEAHGKAKPFADRGLASRTDSGTPGTMRAVSGARGGVVGWRDQGSAIEVLFVDAFAPGAPVRDARFKLPAAWSSSDTRVDYAVVRGGRIALALEHAGRDRRDTRILRAGTAATELDLPSDTSLRALWLGDDGSVVASTYARHDGPIDFHWSPKSAVPTRAMVGTTTTLTNLDARGYDVVEARPAFAARAHVVAGGAALGLGDFLRDPAYADAVGLRLTTCKQGATGERTVMDIPNVRITLDGDGDARPWVEVLVQGSKPCIARASADAGDGFIRADFVAGKADIVKTLGTGWTVQEARCRVSR